MYTLKILEYLLHNITFKGILVHLSENCAKKMSNGFYFFKVEDMSPKLLITCHFGFFLKHFKEFRYVICVVNTFFQIKYKILFGKYA